MQSPISRGSVSHDHITKLKFILTLNPHYNRQFQAIRNSSKKLERFEPSKTETMKFGPLCLKAHFGPNLVFSIFEGLNISDFLGEFRIA